MKKYKLNLKFFFFNEELNIISVKIEYKYWFDIYKKIFEYFKKEEQIIFLLNKSTLIKLNKVIIIIRKQEYKII